MKQLNISKEVQAHAFNGTLIVETNQSLLNFSY